MVRTASVISRASSALLLEEIRAFALSEALSLDVM
jgi:hypothetical protein